VKGTTRVKGVVASNYLMATGDVSQNEQNFRWHIKCNKFSAGSRVQGFWLEK
jgi:hypothetical protein